MSPRSPALTLAYAANLLEDQMERGTTDSGLPITDIEVYSLLRWCGEDV
jgi:hypothetical protein